MSKATSWEFPLLHEVCCHYANEEIHPQLSFPRNDPQGAPTEKVMEVSYLIFCLGVSKSHKHQCSVGY